MRKYQNMTICGLCLSAWLCVACEEKMPEEHRQEYSSEVRFTGTTDTFRQTRATDDNLIGKDGNGAKYGTFYIRQIPTGDQGTPFWGHYKVAEGKAGDLSPTDAEDETYHLHWDGLTTQYYFQALSVPVPEEGGVEGVTFTHTDSPETGSGKVVFGDYKTGLEYFVGATVGPKKLQDAQTVNMRLQRQVSKVIFNSIYYEPAPPAGGYYVDTCEIIFPNLYTSATFDMAHFRLQQGVFDVQNPFDTPVGGTRQLNDYITLDYKDQPKGIRMNWKELPKDSANTQVLRDIRQAVYVHPFKFWDGSDNKPENQSGFFIVRYKGRSFTGNIYGTDEKVQLLAGQSARLTLTLREGNVPGGGEGSIIVGWKIAGEQDVPHYPVPGIYSADDAAALLAALQSGGTIPIPERFYNEKKEIRLFTNIDWSAVTGTLTIPDGYTLVGQGYHIKMGEHGTVAGKIKGTLYINGQEVSS